MGFQNLVYLRTTFSCSGATADYSGATKNTLTDMDMSTGDAGFSLSVGRYIIYNNRVN